MPKEPTVLIPSHKIQQRVSELGRQISKDYATTPPLIVIGVLKGAVYFFADLTREISTSIQVDFLTVSSYVGTQTSGKISIHQDISIDIKNKNILIVEDIVDTGRTLNALIQHLKCKNPRSIKTCALLDKPSRREVSAPVNYCGFRISDHFVVGYGLDHAQSYRNLPYIGIHSTP